MSRYEFAIRVLNQDLRNYGHKTALRWFRERIKHGNETLISVEPPRKRKGFDWTK